MNRTFVIILSLTLPIVAVGQSLSREHITGTWTAKEIFFSEPVGKTSEEKSAVEKTKRGLINSQFIFQPNGIFLLRLPAGAPAEFRELEGMNNKMWHIRAKERKVFVGSIDEDLMTINVKFDAGTYYFLISDSPLMLKMERSR